jgi:acetolactate synthase I/II/III large subunit
VKGQTGAELVLDVLDAEGVEVAFGYPGGTIMPLYDALYRHEVRHILVRHEAAAAFAAGGYARASQRPGVCIATSGPGATNLVTGIADAMLDNVPLVAITGQVRSMLTGTDAFQEIDVSSVTQCITKRSIVVRSVDDIDPALRAAFRLARGPRPGPVLVDIPTDILKMHANATPSSETPRSIQQAVASPNTDAIAKAIEALRHASRPVSIVGGGARWSGAVQAYREFCSLLGAPHCSTLHGLGSASPGDLRFLGMLGMHGTKRANLAVREADCIVALGMRFDDRVTGDPRTFAPSARTVIHAEIDASEFDKNVKATVRLHGDLRATLERLNAALRRSPRRSYDAWAIRTLACGDALPCDAPEDGHLSATDVLDAFFAALPEDAIVTTDVGQHQMWAAQRTKPRDETSFISSGGLGSMGFGFPAAIGAQLAHPDRPTFCIVGDGGFQMAMAELATLRRYDLPVKVLLIDNAHLGMVRQWQQIFFGSRYSETHLPENPDFTMIVRAYDLHAERIDATCDLAMVIRRFVREPGAALLHCSCHPHENVWPMIPSGTSVDQMIESVPA